MTGRERGVREDASLQAAIRAALADAPGLDATDIVVSVEGGQVRLDGHVASPADHDRALAVAGASPGTGAVRSTLRIRPAPD